MATKGPAGLRGVIEWRVELSIGLLFDPILKRRFVLNSHGRA
jgi:hypothetical protein